MIAEIISIAVGALALCIGVGIIAYRAGYIRGQIDGLNVSAKSIRRIAK